jgi:Bacterial regulatory helix-turn-helix protein, lysR family
MRITQLRQADLNLLVIFTVLAEERNVSRAADRLSLSQPAVTRAMQRLRDMFHDDLLVRVSGNYEAAQSNIRTPGSLLKQVAEKGRNRERRPYPQRLKPDIVTITYGRPEGRPLQRI